MGCLMHLPARDDIVTDQQLSRLLDTATAAKSPTSPRLFDVSGNVKFTVSQGCTDKEAAETKTSYVYFTRTRRLMIQAERNKRDESVASL